MTPTLEQARTMWLSQFQETTANNYRNEFSLFCRFLVKSQRRFAHLNPEDALEALISEGKMKTVQVIEYWRTWQQEKGNSANSICKRISAINSFFKYAYYIGATEFFIETRLKLTNLKPRLEGPTVDQVKEILKVVSENPDEYIAARDAAILRLNYDLSLRSREIFSLELSDLHFKGLNSRYLMVKLKRHPDKIKRELPPPTYEALVHWIKMRDKWIKRFVDDRTGLKTGPLFINLTVKSHIKRLDKDTWTIRLNRMVKDKRIPKCTTQLIRHTSITVAVEKVQRRNMPLETVMAFTGHRSILSIMPYRDGLNKYQAHIAYLVSEEV
jgi:integrase